ncbi:MAG: DUF3618 domain-containing protein [Nocardiopsaceae bacterium]|jgi:hypothetical protein|nr:DUF3618 domain-containing protein [Nocardiopsaceae bacterium]
MTADQPQGKQVMPATTAQAATGEADDIPDDPRALAEDIERTRHQVGDSIAALTAKLDVKAQLRDAGNAAARGARQRRVPLAAAGVALLLAGAWMTWLARRRAA